MTSKIIKPCLAFIVAGAILAPAPRTLAADVDDVRMLFDKAVATGGTSSTTYGVFSCYAYKESTDEFYLGIFGFGAAGLRKVEGTGTPWQEDTYTTSTDMLERSLVNRFVRSADVPGGDFDPADSAQTTLSGMLLNPAPLTIEVPDHDASGIPNGGTRTVTYQPGELAFVVDHISMVIDSGAAQPAWTKNIFRWDLREVGAPTSQFPDYSTGVPGGDRRHRLERHPRPGLHRPSTCANAFTAAHRHDGILGRTIQFRPATGMVLRRAVSLLSIDSQEAKPPAFTKLTQATGNAEQLLYSEYSSRRHSVQRRLPNRASFPPPSACDFGSGFGQGDQSSVRRYRNRKRQSGRQWFTSSTPARPFLRSAGPH